MIIEEEQKSGDRKKVQEINEQNEKLDKVIQEKFNVSDSTKILMEA